MSSQSGETEIEEQGIDYRRYIGMVIGYWWLFLLLPLLGGVGGSLMSRNEVPVYEARSMLLVQQRRTLSSFTAGVSDVNISQQLATIYNKQIVTYPFLSEVAADNPDLNLSVDQLKGMMSVAITRDPPALNIRVQHRDRDVAGTAADRIVNGFITWTREQRLKEIRDMQTAALAQGLTNVDALVGASLALVESLTPLEPVSVPRDPLPSKKRQNILLGLVGGLALASGLAYLLSSMNDTVRNVGDLQRRFGVTTLGAIFRWSDQDVDGEELVVWRSPSSGYAESFRQIRANLQFANANNPGNVFIVTSPGPGDGKSTIICNMAVALAQTGKKVVVVDGDLRRPNVHRKFSLERREPGLSNFLADDTTQLQDVIHPTEVEGVSVIPGGPIPPNPSELLGSPRMAVIIDQLQMIVDVILIDSPPVLVVADASVLAAQVDGAILVVDGFKTKSSSMKAAADTLTNTQTPILGVVVNKLRRAKFGYGYYYPYYYDYYYYSYHYSSYYTADPEESPSNGTNGNGALYKKPAEWLKAAMSRRPSSQDGD